MTKRIAGLDGLRALAVLMVFADHRLDVVKPFHLGGFGVRLFFVLSGFLIVGILHSDRNAIASRKHSFIKALSSFYARRSRRIFPAYYAVLGVAAVAASLATIPNYTAGQAPFYWLFLTNILIGWVRHDWVAPFSHLWSLAVEEQFYLIAAPVLLLVPASATRRLCLTVAVLGCGWHGYLVLSGRSAIELGMDPLSNFALIAIGGVAALARDRPGDGSGVEQGLLLLACLLLPLLGEWGFPNPLIRQLIFPLLVALLLVSVKRGQGSATVRLLSVPPLVALGRVSYGFYLYHVFVTADLVRWVTGGTVSLPGEEGTIGQAVCLFGISVALAACSWRWMERPMLQMRRAKAHDRSRGENGGVQHVAARQPTVV